MSPVVGAAEGGERHPQVARGQDVELPAQAPGRAAVVGDRHDGGEVVDHQVVHQEAERREGRVEAVTAAHRDHRLRDLALDS